MDFSRVVEGKSEGDTAASYHYNHAERMEHAPKIVREYYEGRGPRPTKGLFRVLVGNRGNRFMLASIFILVAFIWIYSFFINRTGVQLKIEGQPIAVTSKAFSYEEKVYTNITIAASKTSLKTPHTLTVTYYALDGEGAECLKETQEALYNGSELKVKRVFTDFDIQKVNCHLSLVAKNAEENFAQATDASETFVDFTMKVKKE